MDDDSMLKGKASSYSNVAAAPMDAAHDPHYASVGPAAVGAAPAHEIEYNQNIINEQSSAAATAGSANHNSGAAMTPSSAHAHTRANFASYGSGYSDSSTATNNSATLPPKDAPVYAKPMKRKTATFDDNVKMIDNDVYDTN